MPKTPSYTSKEVIDVLINKGFILDRTKGSHKIFFNSLTNKRAVVPYHRKDLPKVTFFEIIKLAGLTKDDLDQ